MTFLKPVIAEPTSATPVVVELFESQGCSSCPPSERVMKTLRSEFGAGVILLTFHVDYWDYLGWKDTFSDPRWTERQKMYGQLFQQDSIYTPEMVVQGRTGFVGSDMSRARQEVQRAASESREAFILKTTREATHARVSVQLPASLAAHVHDLVAIRVEDASAVHVLRGENRGETMSGDYAVRDMMPMPTPAEGKSSAHLPLGENTPTAKLVVLARDAQGAVIAAQSARL